MENTGISGPISGETVTEIVTERNRIRFPIEYVNQTHEHGREFARSFLRRTFARSLWTVRMWLDKICPEARCSSIVARATGRIAPTMKGG